MENLDELVLLALQVDRILKDELDRKGLAHDVAEVRIYDKKTVGVQGDSRAYSYPAEITLYYGGTFVQDDEFLARLSTRITNEVKGVTRVVYVLSLGPPSP